jgi:tRNA dimethylallyltransferase
VTVVVIVHLFIVGPTGCGKHDVAMALAEKHGAHIISVDSMKVYRGLDIGTAKPTVEERDRVNHALIDILDPAERFTAGEFVQRAEQAHDEIRSRGTWPVYAGGTFLYYKAFAYGLFQGPDVPRSVRDELLKEAAERGSQDLHEELKSVDPGSASRIHPNDLKRIVRALEVHRTTGHSISDLQKEWVRGPRKDIRGVCLMRDDPDLRSRIEARVDRMLAEGLLDETRSLLSRPVNPEVERAIGYAECLSHLKGDLPLFEARTRMIRRTQRFIRRQHTWIKSLPELEILSLSPGEAPEETAERILPS